MTRLVHQPVLIRVIHSETHIETYFNRDDTLRLNVKLNQITDGDGKCVYDTWSLWMRWSMLLNSCVSLPASSIAVKKRLKALRDAI